LKLCYIKIEDKRIKIMKEFLTIKEAAKILDVHWQTIRNWIKKGEIKTVRQMGRIKIPAFEVERLKWNQKN